MPHNLEVPAALLNLPKGERRDARLVHVEHHSDIDILTTYRIDRKGRPRLESQDWRPCPDGGPCRLYRSQQTDENRQG